jgi:hypothetical protein
MSLTLKRLLSFFIFAGFSVVVGFICFMVPFSIWAMSEDPSGSGAGFAIGIFLVITTVAVIPGSIISGMLVLPIINRALKAGTRSYLDYAAFLAAIALSAFVSSVLTYIFVIAISLYLGLPVDELLDSIFGWSGQRHSSYFFFHSGS